MTEQDIALIVAAGFIIFLMVAFIAAQIKVNRLQRNLRDMEWRNETMAARSPGIDDRHMAELRELRLKYAEKEFMCNVLQGKLNEALEVQKDTTIDNRCTALRHSVEFCKVSGRDVVKEAKLYYRFIQGKE